MPKNDYQAFASSFLDLWQEQVARAMSDTDFLQAIMDNMQEMQAGMFGYDAAHKNHPDPADSFEPESDELDDLRRRLDAAERKIIKLEAQLERLGSETEVTPASAKKRGRPKGSKNKPKPAAKAKPAAKKRGRPAKATAAKPAAKTKPATKKPAARKRAVKRR